MDVYADLLQKMNILHKLTLANHNLLLIVIIAIGSNNTVSLEVVIIG